MYDYITVLNYKTYFAGNNMDFERKDELLIMSVNK